MIQRRQNALERVRSAAHKRCFACGSPPGRGLELRCRADDEGRTVASFVPEDWMVSYDGIVHGGIVATVLDSAMTQCLFAHEVTALTAQLDVRYLRPVTGAEPLIVTAWIDEHRHTMYRMRAFLQCQSTVLARANALFIARQ